MFLIFKPFFIPSLLIACSAALPSTFVSASAEKLYLKFNASYDKSIVGFMVYVFTLFTSATIFPERSYGLTITSSSWFTAGLR